MNETTVIHATRAELGTELFWELHVDPVAREHGLDKPTTLRRVDLNDHVLEGRGGGLLLIIRTDREDE